MQQLINRLIDFLASFSSNHKLIQYCVNYFELQFQTQKKTIEKKNILMKKHTIKKILEQSIVKLNLGCGEAPLKGWVNVDLIPQADLILDLSKELPFPNNTVDVIYSEHFLEHLTFWEGQNLLKEILRILKKGGICRFATPDLTEVVKQYLGEDWKTRTGSLLPDFVDSKAKWINVAFRWWGHQYLYDKEEFALRLPTIGFKNITFPRWGESDNEVFRGLESRKESNLIVEFSKH